MDSTNHKLSPLKSPLPSSSHHPTFPIIAVAIIGILATAFLLVSYYIFVIKCCLNWHRIDLLRRFSFSRRRRRGDGPSPAYSTTADESRGLSDAAIRSIPIFIFKKFPDNTGRRRRQNVSECAVCLNEFHDNEKLKILPICAHIFHIDCIDVWLQNNANCPLCRTTISPETKFPITPVSSRDPDTQSDENYVVIEIPTTQGSNSGNPICDRLTNSGCEVIMRTKPGKIGSMGDEWIDIDRNKDEQFLVQPIRRSFSMDSARDTQLCLAVQEIMQRRRRQGNSNYNFEGSPSNEGSSSRGKKNSFFSFGGSRSAVQVQPVLLEP